MKNTPTKDDEVKSTDIVFISHRSTELEVAEMVKDFLVQTGIPGRNIFCSSLPGNDVKFKINKEIKENLKQSVANIAILSSEYYLSAYCLHEAGVYWYLGDEIPVIILALPEITESNMYGFLDNEHKIRRLSNDEDISSMYETIRGALSIPPAKSPIIFI